MSTRHVYPATPLPPGAKCEGCSEPTRRYQRLRLTWWRGERENKKERERREQIHAHGGVCEVRETKLVILCNDCRRLARAE